MGLAMVSDMFLPVYVGKAVDVMAAGRHEDPQALGRAIGYFMIFVALGVSFSLLRSISMFFWNALAVGTMKDIVNDGMHKVQRFSADWHANAFAGATVRKITRGMWAFDMFEDTLFMGLFPAAAMMIGMTAMLAVQVPDVGLFAACSILVYGGFSIWSSVAILAPRFRMSAAADTKVGATLADIITGNPTVKAFGAERREDALFGVVVKSWGKNAMIAWQTGNLIDMIRSLMRIGMMAGMFGVTIWMWSSDRATAGDTALVLTSYFIISGYLRDIGMHITHLQKSASELEDSVHFWMREDEVRDAPDAKTLVPHRGEIVFDLVSFAYEGQPNPVFSDFSICIAPGEKVALVGPSGSGKSTFVKVLQRLYDIQSGEIRIDGQNIAHVTQESLRQAIALVPQDPILFHRSLTENIAYGMPGASAEEIAAAARKAYADDFISGLKLQYDTMVGERGVKLSGGERQRVAIARAILADAPILILDEATSSLDSISEHYIQKALQELMQGKTTITIAHRLATIRKADRILVFSKGKIVEQGSHDILMRRPDSHYKRLFDMQALDLVG
ncbi:MAG TPA: ABC transporter ATP-binding protein [Micavibrio sp.]